MIKPSDTLQYDYGAIPNMVYDEVWRLRAKLAAAEQSRLSGLPSVSLEESRRRLEAIYI